MSQDDLRTPNQMGSEPSEPNPMHDLLEADLGLKQYKRGDTLTGTVLRISPTEILVDIGGKSEGVINGEELQKVPEDVLNDLQIGDSVSAYVVNPHDRSGSVVLALTRTQSTRDWAEAEQLHESQEIFEGEVAGYNKGGVIVKVGKIRGFVPASQLVSAPRRGSDEGAQGVRWASMVGQKIQLKVIELDRERNRLILSERAAHREARKQQREKLLAELQEGDIREGEVISLADFGAFVDLGGADGLIHLSELSWKPINHPKEVIKVGQKVKVYVLKVDPEHKRVGLSLKRLESDPWSEIENRYKVGQLVEGEVTKLVDFGAFARLKDDDAIEGLIHISELSDKRVNHPREVVKEGQMLTLRIVRIEAGKRRLGLSLKRVVQGEYLDEDWRQTLADANEEPAPTDSSESEDRIESQPEVEPPAESQPEAEPPAESQPEAELPAESEPSAADSSESTS
jgi:small subunit ribosomal protein S1